MTAETPKRRWFQFRLRTLLIAIVVLSLPLSWFAVKMERARRQREMVKTVCEAGGNVIYGKPWYPVPKWMRDFFGDDLFFPVVDVGFPGALGDNEVPCLKGQTRLKTLYLSHTCITDSALEHLRELTNLQMLYLDGTQVTDTGLEYLKGLTNLSWLSLDDTQITDAGLEHLAGLTSLKVLLIYDTQVTPEGINKLQEALPNCKIDY